MGNGMIFTNPTIFGMANGRLQGAGDAGPEAVVGVHSLQRMISEAVANTSGNDPSVIYSAVKAGMQDADIGIYLMDRQVGRTLRDMGVAFNA
jgi:phage-related minor tail protein